MNPVFKNWTICVIVWSLMLLGYLVYLTLAKNLQIEYSLKIFAISTALSGCSMIFCNITTSEYRDFKIRRLYVLIPLFEMILAAWISYGPTDEFQLKTLWYVVDPAVLVILTVYGFILTFWLVYSLFCLLAGLLIHFKSSFLRALVLSLYLAALGYTVYKLHQQRNDFEDYTAYYNIWYLGTVFLEILAKAYVAFYLTEQRLPRPEEKLKKKEFWWFLIFAMFTSIALAASLGASLIFSNNSRFVTDYDFTIFKQSWIEAAIHLVILALLTFALLIEGCCYYKERRYSEVSNSVYSVPNGSNNHSLVVPLIQPINHAAEHIMGNNDVNSAVSVERFRQSQERQAEDQGRDERSRSIYFAKECCICQEEYTDKATALKCGHIVHKACLQDWIKRSKICPICRKPVV